MQDIVLEVCLQYTCVSLSLLGHKQILARVVPSVGHLGFFLHLTGCCKEGHSFLPVIYMHCLSCVEGNHNLKADEAWA